MPVHRDTPLSTESYTYLKVGQVKSERCRCAGVPDEMQFATKPELAQKMLQRAFKAEVPAAWVTADEVYGGNRRLRLWLEEQQQAYVMAVSTLEAIEIDARNAQSQSTSIHCRGDCVAAHQLRRWHKRTAIR